MKRYSQIMVVRNEFNVFKFVIVSVMLGYYYNFSSYFKLKQHFNNTVSNLLLILLRSVIKCCLKDH
jgi:hypothetical protein